MSIISQSSSNENRFKFTGFCQATDGKLLNIQNHLLLLSTFTVTSTNEFIKVSAYGSLL